jgi:hypothetical protein
MYLLPVTARLAALVRTIVGYCNEYSRRCQSIYLRQWDELSVGEMHGDGQATGEAYS